MEIPIIVKITTISVEKVMTALAISLSTSVMEDMGGTVKMCYSIVVHKWAASVLQTWEIWPNANSAA